MPQIGSYVIAAECELPITAIRDGRVEVVDTVPGERVVFAAHERQALLEVRPDHECYEMTPEYCEFWGVGEYWERQQMQLGALFHDDWPIYPSGRPCPR